MPPAVTRSQDVGEEPVGRVAQRAQRRIPEAGLDDPPYKIPITKPPGRPERPTAGDHDLAAGLMELLGNLTAGLPASHHENAARRQRRSAEVTLDIDDEYIDGD